MGYRGAKKGRRLTVRTHDRGGVNDAEHDDLDRPGSQKRKVGMFILAGRTFQTGKPEKEGPMSGQPGYGTSERARNKHKLNNYGK